MRSRINFFLFFILCQPNLFAQADTSFIDKQNAIVKLKESNYEGFNKVVRIKKIQNEWKPQLDTIFFNDGNIFRVRTYFYKSLLITIDSFYQHPYNNLDKVLTSIVIGLGDVYFVQSIGDKSKIRSLSIQRQDVKRKELYLNNLLSTKPESTLSFSGVSIRLDDKYYITKIIFTSKYSKDLFNINYKRPFEILFNPSKSPIVRRI